MAPKKSSPNTVGKATKKETHRTHIKFTRKHIVAALVVLVVVWTVLGFAVVRRYKNAVASVLPKKSGNLLLQSFLWTDTAKNKQVAPALNGYVYKTVDVKLKNDDSISKWFSPVLQSYVKDSKGRRYGIEIFDTAKAFEGKNYMPYEVADGQLAFMVPVNDSNLQWCYDTSTAQNPAGDVVCMPMTQDNEQK